MKNKHLFRGLLVASLAAGALGVSSLRPAEATNLCHNEPMPGDVYLEVGSTVAAGVDTGTGGLQYVPVACVKVGSTEAGAGGGATITPTPTGYRIQPVVCDSHTCSPFLISVG